MLEVPSRSDPRWTSALFLGGYALYALVSPEFSRRPGQIFWPLAAIVALDYALHLRRGKNLLPLSALFPAFGLPLMCDSPDIWPFVFVGVAAILSKHFLRAQGRHLFNPLNFGIVLGLLFIGDHIRIGYERWGGHWGGACIVAALGIFSNYKTGRLLIPLIYIAAFLAGAGLLSLNDSVNYWSVAAPATGAIFQLFAFSMLPDPATTPRAPKAMVLFALAVAVLEIALRAFEIRNAPFYSLFVIAGLYPLFETKPG